MGASKDFLEMNKRQRRGAIVVLLVIAMLLLATVAVRFCSTSTPREVMNADLPLFEAQADSALHTDSLRPAKQSRHKKHESSRPRQRKQPRSGKPSRPVHEPRPVEPVPQF